jgi:hypothetical protein
MAEARSQTEDKKGGMNFTRYTIIAAGALILLIVLIFLTGLGLAIFTDPHETAPRIGLMRDIFIIILSLEVILIVIALAALIFQVARLIGLLQTEIKPILTDTRETVQAAKGTAQFVGKNVTQPLISLAGFLAALGAFLRELGGIRRAIRRQRKGPG